MGFWEITETIPELLALLKNQRPEKSIPAYKSEMRQKEWLASRILAYELLEKFTSEKIVLVSNEHGKPFFPETTLHVSISQSAEQVVVAVSNCYEVGIDIEKIKPKAQNTPANTSVTVLIIGSMSLTRPGVSCSAARRNNARSCGRNRAGLSKQ